MGKRADGFYPTDVRAVEAFRKWFLARYPFLEPTWFDPAAGYGGLLAGLAPRAQRMAIELEARFLPLLESRATVVHIGDGTDETLWPASVSVAANPPYEHKLCSRFAEAALRYHRSVAGGDLVVLLVLSTWVRSKSAVRLFKTYGPPSYVLGHEFRLTFDGTGRGDSRTHDWLVWDQAFQGYTRFELLPEPELTNEELLLHRVMSRCVEELFADEGAPITE